MRYDVVPRVPVDHLDRDLLTGSRMRLLPACDILEYTPNELRVWCCLRARYALPTVELIEWLKAEIGDRSALELGSGNGDIGYHAGIRETDSYIQQTPEVRRVLENMRQVPTSPLPAVEKRDALDAIRLYKPRVVVAAWLTRRYELGRDGENSQASLYGVQEEAILDAKSVETYVHIGNEKVHGQKRILSRPHRTVKFPGLLSRTADQSTNVIYIWDRR